MVLTNYINYHLKKTVKNTNSVLSSYGGRNFLGRICVYHKGAGNKNGFIHLDFYRRLNQVGILLKILKDTYRTGYIGLILYSNGLSSFILLSEGLFKGLSIFSGFDFNIQQKVTNITGSTTLLKNIGLFSNVNSIELFPLSGSKMSRAAGVSSLIISKDYRQVSFKMSSGWQLSVSSNCLSTIGMVSNFFNYYRVIGKAGISRSLGIKPTVRGVIKNPCDHPHGGGEGRGSPPAAQVSPWGWLTKGTPSKNKKVDRLLRRKFKKF